MPLKKSKMSVKTCNNKNDSQIISRPFYSPVNLDPVMDDRLLMTELPSSGPLLHRSGHYYHLHQPHLSLTPLTHVEAPVIPLYPSKRMCSNYGITRHLPDPRPAEPPSENTHVSNLYPEILAHIFSYLDVRDKGRAAQVCVSWRDAGYHR